MSSKTRKAPVKRTTPTADYTPEEMDKARALVVKAGRAYQRHAATGEGTLLVQCVEATREARRTGFLADGRNKDRAPQSKTGKEYAGYFGLSSGSEVTFWTTLAKALDAGVSIGDEVWNRLATRQGPLLAKRAEVKAVIMDGGDLAAIGEAMDASVKSRATRAANRSATEKGETEKGETEKPEGIPVTDDPVADAMLAVLALDAAWKRISVEDHDGHSKVSRALSKVIARERTLRQPKRTRKAAEPVTRKAAEPEPEVAA